MTRNARIRTSILAAWMVVVAAGLPMTASAWMQDQPEASKPATPPPAKLGFKNATVEQIVPFIVEVTGKVVMPQRDVMSRQITILSDTPLERRAALDLLFLALQQNGIAVVETATTITLRDIGEVTRQDVPVIPGGETTLDRTDLGTIVQKVFALRNSTAKNIGEIVKDALPDFAKLTVDEESNQIAVMANVGIVQRMERLITSLDRPAAGAVQAETFRLRHADAEAVKTNIEELFSGGSTTRTGANQRGGQQQGGGRGGQQQQQQPPFFRFAGLGGGQEGTTASTGELRVSANTQQNSVTVVADPAILNQIRQQIDTHWDLPLPEEAVVPKTYDLRNTDPVKVRDLLEGLFGRGTAAPRTGGTGGGGQQAQQGAGATQGVGRLAGQFSFQAIPESGRLVVVSKSPDNLSVIDKIIEDLDQPQSVGLPAIIELKHASAEDLAEQLNTLLAQDGTLAQIRRSESGLSQASANISPFATQQDTTGQADQAAQQAQAGNISFWWQRSRPPTDRRNSSNLVGLLRIVPVWRQNSLMVISPPEYRQSIVELIEQLDRPGRQVLISAIVAEVSRDDATALGLRWSSQTINPTSADNSISLGTNAQGTRNDFAESLFNTSVLNANVNLNLLLQALSEKTAVTILSEPKVFTADNQEATFFDGQDIPFVNELQSTNTGNPIQSFEYRAVGLQLRVRPRITPKRDVDLRVNLQLASIAPGQTIQNALIVDRRETTTQLILKDRQTIVISGILRSEDSNIIRKVPLLGDIPIIGELFKSRETKRSNTDLLVFITPLVIENPDEADSVNETYRKRLDERRKELKHDEMEAAPGGSVTPGTPVAPDAAGAAEPKG